VLEEQSAEGGVASGVPDVEMGNHMGELPGGRALDSWPPRSGDRNAGWGESAPRTAMWGSPPDAVPVGEWRGVLTGPEPGAAGRSPATGVGLHGTRDYGRRGVRARPPIPSFASLRGGGRRSPAGLLLSRQPAAVQPVPPWPRPGAARPPEWADLWRLGLRVARWCVQQPIRTAVRHLTG
jgi:hypothetical protein